MAEAPPAPVAWQTPDAAAVLAAGGLLPPGPEPEPAPRPAAGAPRTDTVGARRYAHAALGGRPVVRLAADAAAAGEDAAMALLGFELQGVRGPVGRVQARALGFPAWALAHDPASAPQALAVAREMEPLRRLAQARPGTAREGFDALGNRLARTSPHFLPAYYEEAARAFLEAGSPAHAAQLFGRAREAERTFGLEVDEARQQQVFAEFALAGALTAGDLDAYAGHLAASLPAADAYEAYLDLCLRRTLGGVPPWASMARHLRRLARAAGRDEAAEDRAVVARVLDAPAAARAAFGFWSAYRSALVALARAAPAVRGRLLNLHPSPPREAGAFLAWWLGLLDACGVLAAVIGPAGAVPPEAEAEGGPAAWLGRVLAAADSEQSRRALRALLPRAAVRLRADGRPVRAGVAGGVPDLDLLDLALEAGIPLAAPEPGQRLALHRWWLRGEGGGQRALDHLAADPGFGPLLLAATERWLTGQPAEQLVAAPGPRRLLARWLDHAADRMATGGLVQLDEDVARLERTVSAAGLAAKPAARRRMAAADPAAALARTLRGGLLDELGWLALEEARADLSPQRWPGLRVSPAWPNLVLSDGARAIVVGPRGRLLDHDVQAPVAARQQLQGCLFAGGQLLVCWRAGGFRAYWSGSPARVFDPRRPPDSGWFQVPLGASVELASGGRTAGGRAVHAGDTSLPETRHMLTDGARWWRLEDSGLREYDPTSGRPGERSLPRFLEDFAAGGQRLVLGRSWLLPVPPELEGGPLGGAGGWIGWRVREPMAGPAGASEGQRTDGVGFSGALAALPAPGPDAALAGVPVTAVTFPGDGGRPRPLITTGRTLSLWNPDGRVELLRAQVGAHRPALAPGTPVVPPPIYWACLRPRDPRASEALRRLTDGQAASLLEAALGDLERADEELAGAGRALDGILPRDTHPDLRAGVLGAARMAARIAMRLRALPALRDVPAAPAAPGDLHLSSALSGLVPGLGQPGSWTGRPGPPGGSGAARQIEAVGRYFDRVLGAGVPSKEAMPRTYPSTEVRWMDLVGGMGAAVLRCASPATPEPVRRTLLGLLDLWAATPFAEHPEWFLVTRAVEVDTAERGAGSWLRWSGGRHYFLAPRETVGRVSRRTVVEGAASRRFALLAGFEAESERPVAGCWETPDRLRRAARLVRRSGPFPWRPELALELAGRTGLTRAEAALLLAGLPNQAARQQDFLGQQARSLLDLKTTEAAAARDALARAPPATRVALLAAAMPEEPERLWEEGPDAGRLAEAVVRLLGRGPRVAEEVVVQARAALGPAVAARDLLVAAADPDGSRLLTEDARWEIRPDGGLAVRAGDSEAAFTGRVLLAVASLLPWLFATLPVGDPLRSGLPRLLALARERLANPDLLVGGGWVPGERQGRPVLDLVPGEPYRPAGGRPLPASREAGPLIVVQGRSAAARAFLRPAAVVAGGHGGLARMFEAVRPLYEASRFLLGTGAAGIAERTARTPVPEGGYEADPARSAPDLVAEAGAALGLGPDGATVYLQVLTLAEPTMRNLLTWNDWGHARLAAAVAEALDRGLLVAGRRQRAGREFFLPGPWEPRAAPERPLEAWKLTLYEAAPLGRVLPLRPLHELFGEAWRRVRAGEGPRFEERVE